MSALLPPAATAAENGAAPPRNGADSLRYRRVYAPADGIKDWPTGGMKFMPIEPAEFDRLISAAVRPSPDAQVNTAVRAVTARYQARLVGGQSLAGEAVVEIAAAGKSPALLTLDPCNLAISRARWGDSDSSRAALGTGSDGKLQVLVEKSGQLRLDWSLAGRKDAEGAALFEFLGPACPIGRITLELPSNLAAVVTGGIVADSGPAGEGMRRWQIDVGGGRALGLRITASGAKPPPALEPLALVRQSATYEFSPRGVDVAVQWKLEAHRQPLTQVLLALDPPLRLVSAQCGGEAVPWATVPASGNTPARILLSLPRPIRGNATLALRATMPLVTDAAWKLPRVIAEGLRWQEGSATLLVPATLSLDELQCVGCRQSAVGPAPAPQVGESLQFESFAPDATVEVVLAARRAVVQHVSGTATHLANGKMAARVVADFSMADTAPDVAHFALEADVAPRWTIDSIESQPADALDDWSLDSQGGKRRLTVRLAKPLSPARRVRLVVSARHLYNAGSSRLAMDDVVPLRFLVSGKVKRLVALHAPPYTLALEGGGQPLGLESLSAAELDLFAEPRGEFLLRDDAGAAGPQIILENRKPKYGGAIRVEATIAGDSLRESCVLQCSPLKSSPVDRVLVRFSQRRNVDVRWSVDGKDDAQLSAKPWSVEQETSAGGTADTQTWEVVLREPRSGLFQLRAERESKIRGPLPVSLAALPEADGQQAVLVLRSLGPRPMLIENHRLKCIATEPPPPGQYQTARATYQYDPARDVGVQPEPAILVSVGDASVSSPVWVWDAEVESRSAGDGAAEHLAIYRVQSSGGGRIRVTLPSTIGRDDVRGLWVDGQPCALRSPADAGESVLEVDLPPGAKFATVALQMTAASGRFGLVGWLEYPQIEVDVPVLSRHWTVRLPPGHEAPEFVPDPYAASRRSLSWSQRWLGMLGRGQEQRPFNPLSAEAWSSMFSAPAAGAGAEFAGDASATGGPGTVAAPWTSAPIWAPVQLPGCEPADTPGWATYRLEVAEPGGLALTVVRTSTMHLLGWLVMLLVMLGCWTLAIRPVTAAVLLAAAAIAAILAPVTYVPITSGALVGILLGGLAKVVCRRGPARRRRTADSGDVSSTVAGVAPFGVPLLAFALMSIGTASGAEPANRPAKPAYPVFVPVDDRQQPTGGKYYVPEAFYEQLLRRTADRGDKPQGWLITAATYRVTLSKEGAEQQLAVEDFNADFDIQVLAPAKIRLPLRNEEARPLLDSALLDGRPVQPEWEADGKTLVLDIPEPGQYRLELDLQPAMRPGGQAPGFDLTIPRLASSRLELHVPAGSPSVEVPSALGSVRWEGQPPRLIAELGPAGRLSVRWQDVASEGRPSSDVDVEELLWLKIRPGSLMIDAKLRLRVAAGQLRRLQLTVDPDLQMLPLAGPDAPSVQVRATPEQPQTIDLEWARPIAEAAMIDARFVWTRASSIGDLRLPSIAVVGARSTKRWLGVSIDPSLDHHVQGPQQLEAVAVPEFTADWGGADTAPSFAYRLPAGSADWSLATRPRRPETTAEQTLQLTLDRNQADLRLDAQLTTTSGYVFQHRLDVPKSFRVERISIIAGGTERVARWSTDDRGGATVFLTGPLSGRYDLLLTGTMPVRPGERVPLNLVEMEDVRVQSSTLLLFRRPGVLVEVKPAAGLSDVKEPVVDAGRADSVRLAQALRADGSVPAGATFRLTPNRPRVVAEQIVRLQAEPSGWKAVADCRLHVTGGVLDEVRIDAVAPWIGPYKVSPATALRVVEGAGDNRTLVLRPRTAIAGDYQFTVSSPLDLEPSDRPAAPEIALRSADQLKRYLVLPRQAHGQPAAWQTQGLRQGQPAEVASISPSPGATAYEVVGATYRAVLQLSDTPSDVARVRLADLRMAWQPDGACRGAAVFDVEPGRLTDCPLWLPAGSRLLYAAVAATPVDPLPVAPGVWRLPLAETPTSQRVEILFAAGSWPGDAAADLAADAGTGSDSNVPEKTRPARENSLDPGTAPMVPAVEVIGSPIPLCVRCRLRAPRLGDLPVETTQWTIAAPRTYGPGTTEETAIDGAESSAGKARQAARDGDRSASAASPAAGRRPPGGAEAAALWQSLLDDSWTVTQWTVSGPADFITLRYVPAVGAALPVRAGVAVFIGLLALVAVLLIRRGRLWQWYLRWPYGLAVVFGLVWWLWCWPSIVGLIIVLLSLARQFIPWPMSGRRSATSGNAN